MRIRLGISILCLLISWTAFSQQDTVSDRLCFSTPVAKAIAIDLVKGDSAKAELQATQILLAQIEAREASKDSTINEQRQVITASNIMLGAYQHKEENYKAITTTLNQTVRKQGTQIKLLQVGLSITVTLSIVLLIIK